MKMITKAEAVRLIQDDDFIGISGFAGNRHPETLSAACEESFLANGYPKNLSIQFSAGSGDGKERGSNHFGHRGMVKRIISGHYGLAPKLGWLITENAVEAYNVHQGTIAQLFCAAAAGKPGVLTKVGLGTFVDPRVEGGKLNTKTVEEIVKVVQVGGEEYLYYRAFAMNVALIHARTIDEKGNLIMDLESSYNEAIAIIGAAKTNGGIVIAEVEQTALRKTLGLRMVTVPGSLVDYVVMSDEGNDAQTFGKAPSLVAIHSRATPLCVASMVQLDEREVIARRAAMGLVSNCSAIRGRGGKGMTENIVEEKWQGMKDGVKKWAIATENELHEVDGIHKKLLAILQIEYGYSKGKAEREFEKFIDGYKEFQLQNRSRSLQLAQMKAEMED